MKILAAVLNIFRVILAIIIILHLSFFLVTAVYLNRLKDPDPANANPTETSLMRYRREQQQQTSPDRTSGLPVKKPGFVPLREIPADIISSVIFIEDFDFFSHPGIDIDSIKFAIKINKKLGYMAYGGSTLTQQISRTLFLNPSKNYVRKYLEILVALQMEMVLPKERILELYLNFAEWGKNMYGIRDAAAFYFRQPPAGLNDEAKLALLTLLANPRNYTPATFRKNKMLAVRYRALEFFFKLMKEHPPSFRSRIREIE